MQLLLLTVTMTYSIYHNRKGVHTLPPHAITEDANEQVLTIVKENVRGAPVIPNLHLEKAWPL